MLERKIKNTNIPKPFVDTIKANTTFNYYLQTKRTNIKNCILSARVIIRRVTEY